MSGGIINSGSFPKALFPGVKKWFGQDYDTYPVQYTQLFDTIKSDRAWEEFVGTSGFGLASVKTEGGPVTYQSEQQGFTTRAQHVVYATGFVITKEMMDDDQYMLVGERRSKSLARSLRQTKEVVAANVYNRAFNTSFTFGDGKRMISSDHPNIAGGTFSNVIGTSADLSEAALEQAVLDIQAFTDDAGILMGTTVDSLIIHRNDMYNAQRILKSDLRVDTPNNDLNALKTLGWIPEIVVNQFLTDNDAWFIRTSVPGLVYVEREADRFEQDNDFGTKNALFMGYGRYSFACYEPRTIYGSPGA